MPPTIEQPARQARGGGPRPKTNRARVKSLEPLDILYGFAANPIEVDAEPPPDELVAELKAGRQPYPAVVIGVTVLFGLGLIRAAKAAGVDAVEICECDGRERLNRADYGLRAAGLHLRAVLRRLQPDPFEARLLKARVYEIWGQHLERKRPQRHRSEEQKRQREEVRKGLVEQEFECAVRSLQRDVIVSHLPRELRDAVRLGLLPARAITTALERITVAKQKELAARLTGGVKFTNLEEDYFGKSGKGRRTEGGKVRAIRRSITTLTEEGRALEGRSVLRPQDCPDAEEAVALLSGWIARPAQPSPLDAIVQELSEEVGLRKLVNGAARGVRGAAEGRK